MPSRDRLTWPQWLLLLSGLLGLVNAVRQGLFATATVSPRLATLSGATAIAAAMALWFVRRRHSRAVVMLGVWAVMMTLAVVVGTELFLARALPLPERLPGYLLVAGYAALTTWGGVRELARPRLPRSP